MNSTGSNSRNLTNYKRRDGERYNRRDNENSNRRDGENFRRRDGEGRIFKCRECGGVGHYQAKCLTFFRKQKKNFHGTLSDEETDDSEEDDGCTNAFIVYITETNFIVEDEGEDSEEESKNNLSFKQLKIQWKEDSEARVIEK